MNSVSRIFDDIDESIKLAKEFESTGISAIAVHGRTRRQKSSEPINKGYFEISYFKTIQKVNLVQFLLFRADAIKQIAENLKIPVIANGGSDDIQCYEDIEKFRNDCGASSVMIARGVQKNVSIFRKEGKTVEFILEFVSNCIC